MRFKITWLGQSGYIFEFSKTKICIDPYLSNIVEKVEGLKRLEPVTIFPKELNVDYLITTHDHLDHFDENTISDIEMRDTIFIGPTSCIEHFRSLNKKCREIITLNRGNSLALEDIVIHAVFSNHTSDSIGIVLKDNGCLSKSVYLTGDTEFNKKLYGVSEYSPDLVIGCINGRWGNMSYSELAELVLYLRPSNVIPSHYGMFAENTEDPGKLKNILKGHNIKFQQLEYAIETEILI